MGKARWDKATIEERHDTITAFTIFLGGLLFESSYFGRLRTPNGRRELAHSLRGLVVTEERIQHAKHHWERTAAELPATLTLAPLAAEP